MAYSELIKNFDKIRDYMRDFYVYGFRTRSEYDQKSARSYDNVRRRIESWLGPYMSFHKDSEGKHVFLSVDSRAVPFNPLYQAYKSKSFTTNDLMLHFLILDILSPEEVPGGPSGEIPDRAQDAASDHTGREVTGGSELPDSAPGHTGREITGGGELPDGASGHKTAEDSVISLSAAEILEQITERFARMPETDWFPDESTLRKKLKEYTGLGVLKRRKQGREVLYSRNDTRFDPERWSEALCFASETDPLGVIGACLLDRLPEKPVFPLRFKHHYLLNAFDQEILSQLMEARRLRRRVQLTMAASASAPPLRVYPLRFYCSTQTGRRWLFAWQYGGGGYSMFRLDRIRSVRVLEEEAAPLPLEEGADQIRAHVWGVSAGNGTAGRLDHVEMEIRVEENESYLRDRLLREKRCGTVTQIDEHTLRFSAEICDALEILPWIRTFTGRILSFRCSNPAVSRRFSQDLEEMRKMYLQDRS